ncbi:hypothetical protein ACW73L_10170 [Methylolobus aquaticus]
MSTDEALGDERGELQWAMRRLKARRRISGQTLRQGYRIPRYRFNADEGWPGTGQRLPSTEHLELFAASGRNSTPLRSEKMRNRDLA